MTPDKDVSNSVWQAMLASFDPRGSNTQNTYRQGSAELGISERPKIKTLPSAEDPKNTFLKARP